MLVSCGCRELYIDGNDLHCQGALQLLKACSEQANKEYAEKMERLEAERIKKEEEERLALESGVKLSFSDCCGSCIIIVCAIVISLLRCTHKFIVS